MVSLATLLSWKGEKPLGGVMGLSGFQPLEEDALDMNIEAVRATPLFYYHGESDDTIPLGHAQRSIEYL